MLKLNLGYYLKKSQISKYTLPHKKEAWLYKYVAKKTLATITQVSYD